MNFLKRSSTDWPLTENMDENCNNSKDSRQNLRQVFIVNPSGNLHKMQAFTVKFIRVHTLHTQHITGKSRQRLYFLLRLSQADHWSSPPVPNTYVIQGKLEGYKNAGCLSPQLQPLHPGDFFNTYKHTYTVDRFNTLLLVCYSVPWCVASF